MQYSHPITHGLGRSYWYTRKMVNSNYVLILESYMLTLWTVHIVSQDKDTMDSLNGAVWFTALHLKSCYWQAKMDEASKPLVTFTIGPLGFYKCDYMPFGKVNAPATFQRLMETCLGDLQLNWCFIYLNDIIVFWKMPKDHLVKLRRVFQKIKEAGLKLKSSKWIF